MSIPIASKRLFPSAARLMACLIVGVVQLVWFQFGYAQTFSFNQAGSFNQNFSVKKPSPDTVDADIVGEAFDRETGELLYREYYTLDDHKLPSKVEYRLPDGQPLATKKLRFLMGDPTDRTMPSVEHHNLLTGRLMEVQRDDVEGGKISIRYRESHKGALEIAAIPFKKLAVVDAGFDEFVRQYWDRLLAKESLIIYFLMPSRLDFVALRLSYRTIPPNQDEWSKQAVWIQATPANGLLRLFVDPIDLYYQRDSRRLIRYSGVSNLVDPSGSSMTVDIRYRYRQ